MQHVANPAVLIQRLTAGLPDLSLSPYLFLGSTTLFNGLVSQSSSQTKGRSISDGKTLGWIPQRYLAPRFIREVCS